MDSKSLRPIAGYEEYLKSEEQKKDVFPRAIIGMARI
jgi:hypothetical protein